MSDKPLQNKKIAMVIAFQDFRDEEYFIPKGIFAEAGFEVKTISPNRGKAVGSYGGVVDVDIVLDDFDCAQFEVIIFVGGQGMAKNINNAAYHKIARQAVEQSKFVGAICIAPAILAKAGVLEGKKATVWASPMDKSAVKILKEEGVDYQSEPVVVDGKIITANGPSVARKFAQAIVALFGS